MGSDFNLVGDDADHLSASIHDDSGVKTLARPSAAPAVAASSLCGGVVAALPPRGRAGFLLRQGRFHHR